MLVSIVLLIIMITSHLNVLFLADVSGIVAQAMATYKTINDQQGKVYSDEEASSTEEPKSQRYESSSPSAFESITSSSEKPPQ